MSLVSAKRSALQGRGRGANPDSSLGVDESTGSLPKAKPLGPKVLSVASCGRGEAMSDDDTGKGGVPATGDIGMRGRWFYGVGSVLK